MSYPQFKGSLGKQIYFSKTFYKQEIKALLKIINRGTNPR